MSSSSRQQSLREHHEKQRQAAGLPAGAPIAARGRVPAWLWAVVALGVLVAVLMLTQ